MRMVEPGLDMHGTEGGKLAICFSGGGFRATLFSEGFVKTIAERLAKHGVPLTGHVDQEEIVNPVGLCGDLMKSFQYQPILGLDQVFKYGRGSRMYKLISSAANNYDRACGLVSDDAVREFLRFLAGREREHAVTLERLCEQFHEA